MTYHFSLMRFVPDPARGEFINLGALAGDDENRDWEFRIISNLQRARAIDDRGALTSALGFASEVEAKVEAVDRLPLLGEHMTATLLERWAREMRNVVQFSWPAPIVADTADDALDLIFEELVLDPAARRYRFQKKHRAVGSVSRAYRVAGVPSTAVLRNAVGSTDDYRDRFDFGVHNGVVRQLVRCWSFQLPAQDELADEVKAWAWLVRHLQEGGGILSAPSGSFEIRPGEFDTAVVYIPPIAGTDAPAFDEAEAAFAEIKVSAVPADQAATVAQAAQALLASH
jgi:hypothetical protein